MLVRTNCWVEDKIVQDGDIALELGHFRAKMKPAHSDTYANSMHDAAW